MSARITTGDDALIIHTLQKTQKTFVISGTAIVTCRLVTMNHEIITDTVVQSVDTVGADWSNSVVAVLLPALITSSVADVVTAWSNGTIKAKLETQVDDNGKLTWFEIVDVVRGTID